MIPLSFSDFLEIMPLIFLPSMSIIGLTHFFISFLSFRVFSCSIKTIFIPCIAAVLGMLWSVLHVLTFGEYCVCVCVCVARWRN